MSCIIDRVREPADLLPTLELFRLPATAPESKPSPDSRDDEATSAFRTVPELSREPKSELSLAPSF